MARFTVIDVWHHPDGVMLPGETVVLSEATAARGLATGSLVRTPEPKPAPQAPASDSSSEE